MKNFFRSIRNLEWVHRPDPADADVIAEEELLRKNNADSTSESMPMDELYFNNIQQHQHNNDDLDIGVHHE